ncbi:glycosyltransferase family 39 protein [bacterium]|nr:glycosyltransferase family 39 protein [bacterium]
MTPATLLESAGSRTAPPRVWISILFLAAIVIGSVAACRSRTITLDTSVFIRFASQWSQAPWSRSTPVESESWRGWLLNRSPAIAVLDHHAQHPAFAISVASVRNTLRPWIRGSEELLWIVSVHTVSLLGFGFLVVGIYRFGEEWLGEAAGVIGALAVLVSPPLVRIAGDALSDAPSAAFLVWSLVWMMRYLRQGMIGDLLKGGGLAGIGYLFRPEAIQVALAMLVVLLIGWIGRPSRWNRLAHLSALAATLAIFVLPYMAIKGSPLTKKSYLLDPAVLRSMHTSSETISHESLFPNQQSSLVRVCRQDIDEVVQLVSASESDSEEQALPKEDRSAEAASLPKYIPAIDLRWRTYVDGVGLFLLLWSSLLAHSLIGLLPIGGLMLIVDRPRAESWLVVGTVLCNFLFLPALLYCACGYLDVRHIVPTFSLTAPLLWPGGLALCRGVRAGLSWISIQIAGRPIRWPMTAEHATGLLLGFTLMIVGTISISLRSNEQLAGLRTLGFWMREQISPKSLVIDPSYVTAFYAGMDGQNRWPYVGNLSPENLADVLDAFPEARYVVLSDRQAAEALGQEHWPTDLRDWHLDEIHSERISKRPDDQRRVRLFRATSTVLGPPPVEETARLHDASLDR